ncbi:MAG: IPExxxVDY family protein [Brumimicrobium sp.]|nr:IPExxxVDY family protein [Brumimicrobium sp.]
MAKHTLKLEEDYDFDLIGLCSHHSDYRLCWAINDHLDLALSKAEEPFMVSGKKGEIVSSHSLYEWRDEENQVSYFLIGNKNNNQFLIPEKAQIDYFLVIREAGIIEIDDFLTRLKQISSILTAFIYDPGSLKSGNKLIF